MGETYILSKPALAFCHLEFLTEILSRHLILTDLEGHRSPLLSIQCVFIVVYSMYMYLLCDLNAAVGWLGWKDDVQSEIILFY